MAPNQETALYIVLAAFIICFILDGMFGD